MQTIISRFVNPIDKAVISVTKIHGGSAHNVIDDKVVSIDETGNFEIEIDIFKGLGGELESGRLNVPLLGKINLDPLLSTSSDKGVPYVINEPKTYNYFEFEKISHSISFEQK